MVGYCEMMLQFSPQNHLYVQRNLDKGRFHPVPWLQGNDGGTMQGRMNATATPYVWCLKGFAVHLAIGKLHKDHHTSSQNATIMVLMTMMMITSSPDDFGDCPFFRSLLAEDKNLSEEVSVQRSGFRAVLDRQLARSMLNEHGWEGITHGSLRFNSGHASFPASYG